MNKKKIFSFILILNIFLVIFQPISVKAVEAPVINARAGILMNPETGEIYYSHNADLPLPPASTTKVMTALLAFEAIERGDASLNDMVTASGTSHEGLTADGSTQNIIPGETMSLENLLYCMLVSSANEACNIVGEYIYGGEIQLFINRMNERAKELGCTGTYFENTHGLPSDRQCSTAHDLALITAEAMTHPKFNEITNTVYKEIPATNKSDARFLMNSNYMINPDRSAYYYSEASGIKTGSTEAAGYCLISSVVKQDFTVISVLLGCSQVTHEDGSVEVQSFTESKKLLSWFLENYSMRTVVDTMDLVCEVPVELGEGANSVVCRPQDTLSLLLPNDFEIESLEKEYTIFSQLEGAEPLTAPVSAGDIVGEMRFDYAGTEYGPIPLVANNAVSLSKLAYLQMQVKNTLSQPWVKWMIGGFLAILILYLVFVIRYNIIRRKRRRAAYEAAKRGTANSAPINMDDYRK